MHGNAATVAINQNKNTLWVYNLWSDHLILLGGGGGRGGWLEDVQVHYKSYFTT